MANQSKADEFHIKTAIHWSNVCFTITTPYMDPSHYQFRSAVIEVYQAMNGLSSTYKQCMFTLNKTTTILSSSSDNTILLPICHTTLFGLKSCAYKAGSVWNKLLNSFRTCESLKDFRTNISTWSIVM